MPKAFAVLFSVAAILGMVSPASSGILPTARALLAIIFPRQVSTISDKSSEQTHKPVLQEVLFMPAVTFSGHVVGIHDDSNRTVSSDAGYLRER